MTNFQTVNHIHGFKAGRDGDVYATSNPVNYFETISVSTYEIMLPEVKSGETHLFKILHNQINELDLEDSLNGRNLFKAISDDDLEAQIYSDSEKSSAVFLIGHNDNNTAIYRCETESAGPIEAEDCKLEGVLHNVYVDDLTPENFG